MHASTSNVERLPVRLFNGVQRLMVTLGRRRSGFAASEDQMHEDARKAVGFDDFGDPAYREGLRTLLDAYDREARLTPFGRMLVAQQLAGVLRSRLSAEKALRERPAILANDVKQPIFVLGLPRTGTTALHHLLGQDPGVQVLEYWLAASPAPRPPRETWEKEPGYKQAARDLKVTYWLDPKLKAIHLMTADGPEECRHLLQHTFTDDTFDCNSTIPSYSEWYGARDMRPTYAQHRRLLQLIGSPTPERRWVLKYPVHMGNMDALLAAYPDACFVQPHRDPARVLPSICSLVAGWRAIYEGDVDRRAIAVWQLELWASRLERLLEARKRLDSSRFFDLEFREVVSDPLAAIRRMYAHFGIELSPEGERAIARFAAGNPRGKHGEHRYSAADFGLTDAAMHDRFAGYMEHFDILSESAA